MNIVYKITNKINKKFYIGSTKDLDGRMNVHFGKRRLNDESEFYEDVEKYGEHSFKIDILLKTSDMVKASREESRLIRENADNALMYNKMVGASGRRVFYESDIVFIRDLYDSKSIYVRDAYKNYYEGTVSYRAFKKAWQGETFKDIHYHVYTKENKDFHFSWGQSRPGETNGKAIFKEYQVLDIRQRQKRGEEKQSVYEDYKYLNCKHGFYEIWTGKNWRNIQA